MANILSLKRRVQVAQNVKKTTRAMQMIAASKLKRAKDAALSGRPYSEKLTQVSQSASQRIDKEDLPDYLKVGKGNRTLFIVILPDKGLAGSLITNLVKQIVEPEIKQTNELFITVGKKAELSVLRLRKEIVASFPFGTTLPSFEIVYPILKVVDEHFLGAKASSVEIISTKFESLFSQKPVVTRLLPIKLGEEQKSDTVMLFEPNVQELLPNLLRHYLETILYQNILESYASEQAARMIAMKNATDNAEDIIEDLKLEFNKLRQEKITNEILDIASSTMALSYEE